MHFISALSTEYVRVAVGAVEAGSVLDPSDDTLQMAFVATGGSPAVDDWKSATWETDTTTDPDTYYARALIGPGAGGVIALTSGAIYDVFVKIQDSPEIVVKRTGALGVF